MAKSTKSKKKAVPRRKKPAPAQTTQSEPDPPVTHADDGAHEESEPEPEAAEEEGL
jgi:hypothetical protein